MPDLPQIDEPTPLSDETSRPYGALKCCFYTPKRGDVLGAFCLLFNGATGEVLDNVFWVTHFYEAVPLDVNVGWREMNKLIPEIGPYEKSLGGKLLTALLETFSPPARIELMQAPEGSGKLVLTSSDIRKSFERVAHYFLEFNISLESLARKDLVEAGILAPEGESKQSQDDAPQDEEKKSFEGTLVHCLPIIDPVKGKPVSELAPGDLVEVRIQSAVGAGNLIRQYLSSTNQEALFPVESVQKKDDDKTYIFLTISDEIRGLVTVTKDLRFRTLRIGEDKKRLPTINVDTLIFLGTLFVAGVVIFWVVRNLLF